MFQPHEESGFAVFTGSRGELLALFGANPRARVQDPASAAPVAATAKLQPRLIIDACAGQGTKTKQLASVHPTARIIATDINQSRRAALGREFAAGGLVQVVEPQELAQFTGQADVLVLDVPCSNTGVLARRVEAKYRCNTASITGLVAVQRQIVADSIALLAPGGCLLYATCSIDSAENQQQSDWISRQHDLTVTESRLILPRGLPGEAPSRYHDGGFFALLRHGPETVRQGLAGAGAPSHG
jgi:16S rRNA (cytosine967-C5)-methyltransferase